MLEVRHVIASRTPNQFFTRKSDFDNVNKCSQSANFEACLDKQKSLLPAQNKVGLTFGLLYNHSRQCPLVCFIT